jgi:hypothetical protein
MVDKRVFRKTLSIKALSDFVNNRTQDTNAFLSVTFPLEWIKKHPDYLQKIPKTSEIVPSNTLIQQFDINEKWLAKYWNGAWNTITK